MQAKLIDAETALPLRAKILRPNLPISEAKYANDNSPSTFHVGGFSNDTLTGVATFYPELYQGAPLKNSFRLRGMAVDTEIQGKGVGKLILQFGEKLLIERKAELLWFNAREVAFPFYTRLGYEFAGPMFNIENIGPHKVMFKLLK